MCNFSFAIQILPFREDEENIIIIVDKIIDMIKSSGLKYSVSPFETTVEGKYEECMKLLADCIFLSGELSDDIFANIKIHYAKSKEILKIDEKIKKYN